MTQRHPVQNDTLLFVTTNTFHRTPVFRDPACAREAVECLYRVQELHPFLLYGFAIMPDHCHFLLMVPAPGTVSGVIGTYKSGLVFDLGISNRNHGSMRLWQRRFHATTVQNAGTVLQYIHLNPVRAGLAKTPEKYPWSSSCGRWDVTPLGW